jgi:hypothetical protein
MTKKPESRKVKPPKSDPKKFIVAFLPRRDGEKDTRKKPTISECAK